jgi:parvulin-like peptidyl-prolyl isomerase
MKSVLRIICIMSLLFIAAVVISACAKHQPAADPITPAAVSQKEESAEDEAKRTIVAQVNGVDLSMASLIKMMNRLRPKEGSTQPETLEEHKKRSLDKLVLQELAYQQAKAQGITIGSDKVDMAMKNLRDNVGGEKEYADYLAAQHVTEEELRAQVERSLTIELDYAKEVLGKVKVPEADVREAYEKEKHLYITPEKVSVADVWVLQNEGKTSKKKADELLRKIKADKGKNPWSLVLDGSFIVRNVDVSKDRDKELYSAAKKLKIDGLSGVVKTSDGYHIIKLKDYVPQRQLTFDEVKGKLEARFRVPAQQKRTEEWEQELKKDAKIEVFDPPKIREKKIP